MKAPSLPYFAFAGCALIWGSTFLVIRVGNDALPPLWACTWRLLLASVILNLILFGTGQLWPKGDALKAAFWYGLWEFGIGMPLLYWGERVTPSGLAAVIYAICPVVAVIEAKALGMEEVNIRFLGAGLLALSGVAVVFWRELSAGGSALGLGAIFLAALAAPVASLMLQRGPRQSAVGSNAVGSLVGFVCSVVASFAVGEAHAIPTKAAEILPIVYLAVAGSAGAFVLFAWLTQHWKTTKIAFLGVVVPVIAVTLGAAVRHEALAAGSLVGAAIVIVGVTIALRTTQVPGAS